MKLSKSDERLTFTNETTDWPCIFRQHHKLFLNKRRTNQSGSTRSDAGIWCNSALASKEVRASLCVHWITWPCHSPWAPQCYLTKDWHQRGAWTHNNRDVPPVFLDFLFNPPFCAKFRRLTRLLNKKLCNDPVQLFCRRANEEIATVDTLKCNLVNPTALVSPRLQAPTTCKPAHAPQCSCVLWHKNTWRYKRINYIFTSFGIATPRAPRHL